jgi:hypothetical protein
MENVHQRTLGIPPPDHGKQTGWSQAYQSHQMDFHHNVSIGIEMTATAPLCHKCHTLCASSLNNKKIMTLDGNFCIPMYCVSKWSFKKLWFILSLWHLHPIMHYNYLQQFHSIHCINTQNLNLQLLKNGENNSFLNQHQNEKPTELLKRFLLL